jgi:hypothetical protein
MNQDTKYYEDIIDLTAHPAWPKLVEDIHKEIYYLQAGALDNLKTIEELYFAKGYAAALAATANLRDTAKRVLDEIEAPVEGVI